MNIKKLISSFLLVFCFSGCANQKITQIESLEPGNLSGVNLFCEEQDLFVTYSFFDQNRYETTNYFLVYFDIGTRMGSYGLTSNARYLFLKADKKLTIYNKLNKNDDQAKWTTKVVESPKLDYYFDSKDLNIVSAPSKFSQIKSTCKIFTGTADELRKSTLMKYQKNL